MHNLIPILPLWVFDPSSTFHIPTDADNFYQSTLGRRLSVGGHSISSMQAKAILKIAVKRTAGNCLH